MVDRLKKAVDRLRQFPGSGPQVPEWDRPDLREIVAFRNVLIHGYAQIDRARVWRAVEDDLPALRAVWDNLLAEPR